MDRDSLSQLREKYPIGTVVELISMEKESQMPPGLKGTVDFVDDSGQIHVNWTNGSSLALIVNIDKFKVVTDK